MRPIRLLLGLLVACTLLVLVPSTAYACSCATESVREYVDGAELVVRGTVQDRDDGVLPGGDDVYRIAVDRVYQGQAGPVAEIHSSGDGDTCGLEVTVGRAYVVFAHTSGGSDASGGEYRAGLCGGTSAATPELVAEVEEVAGPGTAPDPALQPTDDDVALSWTAGAVLAGAVGVLLAWRIRRS